MSFGSSGFRTRSRGPQKLAFGVFAGVAVAAGLLSALPPAETPPEASTCRVGDWQAESADEGMGVEILPTGLGQVDVIRETYVTTTTDDEGNTVYVEEDVPLSPIGVYLGDGLFFDTNGNISFYAARAFGEPLMEARDGTIVMEQSGPLNDATLERQGSVVEIDNSGFGKLNDITVTETGNEIKIDPSLFGEWNTIRITENGQHTRVDPFGFGGWDSTDIIRSGDQIHIRYPGFWNNVTITRGENSTQLDLSTAPPPISAATKWWSTLAACLTRPWSHPYETVKNWFRRRPVSGTTPSSRKPTTPFTFRAAVFSTTPPFASDKKKSVGRPDASFFWEESYPSTVSLRVLPALNTG